jgi:putative ATP-binding cassette transporter
MKLIVHLLHTSRRTAIVSILTGCLCGACTAALVAVINAALERNLPAGLPLVVGFSALLAALIGLTIASQALLVRLAEGSVYALRMRLSRQILNTPLRRLETVGAHRLLAVLTEDIGAISHGYLNLPTLFVQGTALLVGLTYLGLLSWALLLAGIGFLVVGAYSYLLLAKRGQRAFTSAREKQDSLFKHFRGLTEGTKELKIHRPRREAFVNELLQPTAEDARRHVINGLTAYAVARAWGNSLFFVLIGLLLFVFPLLYPVSSYALRGAAMIVLYMISPLAIILNMLPAVGQAVVALRKVEDLGLALDLTASEDAAAAPLAAASWEHLQLEGITHTYYREQEDSHFALGPINLAFRPGELVFLVGGNGSGKTTLAKVLVGLYAPESGTICLNGQPISEAQRETYRQLFSVVFSDFYLFDQVLGLTSSALDVQARAYLAQLHLDQKVKIVNGMLSTTDLSQGQRKRLALLAAYLEDRPFYVFDEWAADQDPIFKELFYVELLPALKKKGKTVLAITHDDTYYHLADRVIKLEQGMIIGETQGALKDAQEVRVSQSPDHNAPT